MHSFFYAASVLVSTFAFANAHGFDASSNTNVAMYWVRQESDFHLSLLSLILVYRVKEVIKNPFAISVTKNPSILSPLAS